MNLTSKLAAKYKVLSDYNIPKIPDALKHAKTLREKQYLQIIEELMSSVKKDPMTGLQHKEHFQGLDKGKGVFIMIDGDGLKKINDTYGHAAGHAAILSLSDGIKASLRSKDKATITNVTRAGGDEFLVHMENVLSLATGVSIAKRMLESINKQSMADHYNGDKHIRDALSNMILQASIGVGFTEKEADEAMYKAKQKGRNRVEFHRVLKAA